MNTANEDKLERARVRRCHQLERKLQEVEALPANELRAGRILRLREELERLRGGA